MNNLPPQNIDIESACLSSALLSKTALLKLINEVQEDDFYLDKNRIIFQALLELSKSQEVDLIILKDYLQKKDQLDAIGGVSCFTEIFNNANSGNIEHYIQELIHYSKLRKIIHVSTESIDSAHGQEDPQEIISKISNQIKTINWERNKSLQKLSEIMGDRFKDIQLNPDGYVATGIEPIDKEILGFLPGDLVILGARPSMGKTSLALNIANNLSAKDPVLFFSLEQSSVDIAIRLLCAETNISFNRIKIANRLDELEWESIQKAYEKIKKLNLYVFDRPARPSNIINMTKRIMDYCKPKLIITDYLQLIIPEDRKLQRHLQIQEVTRSFKNFAKETGIPHLLLCQLNRAGENRKDRRPILSDLRESGDIEQDGDKILFIHRESLDNPLSDLIIAKYRNGKTGYVELDFNGRAMQFS